MADCGIAPSTDKTQTQLWRIVQFGVAAEPKWINSQYSPGERGTETETKYNNISSNLEPRVILTSGIVYKKMNLGVGDMYFWKLQKPIHLASRYFFPVCKKRFNSRISERMF